MGCEKGSYLAPQWLGWCKQPDEMDYINAFFLTENIIFNQLQKNQMMNYMSMMPNYYCVSALQTPSYAPLTPQKEIKPFPNVLLLQTIAQALTKSLKNYQNQLTNASLALQKMQIQTVSSNEKLNNSEKPIEIIISEEEDGETTKPKLDEQTTKTALKPCMEVEKPSHPTLQLPTDDQNLNESKETPSKKDNEPKKKNRKNRCEANLKGFQVDVPEVDLIDTAYLPQLEFSYQSLAKRREQLMNRRVGDWNDFIKAKKERREIRMLGN